MFVISHLNRVYYNITVSPDTVIRVYVCAQTSVMNPDPAEPDSDPTFQFDADLDPDPPSFPL
jgi:hypothetical protein